MNGKSSHTALRGLIVLKSEERSRNEYRYLLPVKYGFVRRAKCYLGLAESDVSAKKSVHWDRAFHVFLDFLCDRKLGVGLLILKCRLKIALKVVIGRECVPRAAHSFRV